MILCAFPRNAASPPDPLKKELKVDTLHDVRNPHILSCFEEHIIGNGLRDDLDNFFRHGRISTIQDICDKMMKATE